MALGVREGEARRARVLGDLGRLHAAFDKAPARGLEVVDVERDRRHREIEVVRVVFHQLERNEREAALHRAIAELPEERRVVVVLRDVEGLAYDEIAAALGLELGTVRSRLHRARLELKDKLERYLT